MKSYINENRATILITALWIVAILTVFAVSVGRQSAISLKLTSYHIDKLRAYFIARSGIMRALAEKNLEYKTLRSVDIDALSERWANNKDLFDNHKFGEGSYTVGYQYQEKENSQEAKPMLYGLMDEQSKININYAPMDTLVNLMVSFDVDEDEAKGMAASIIDWRDDDDNLTSVNDVPYGAEDSYYMGLSPSYHCKNKPFEIIYELLLVRGVTADIFNKIKDCITVYGDGKVNINTSCETALNALFGPTYPNLASKIIRYREGNDKIIGTKDDRWFCLGPYIIDRASEGLIEIKNLQDADWYANIYNITSEEYNRIRELITKQNAQLCVSSKAYRALSTGSVKGVKSKIEVVYFFEKRNEPPVVKFWRQE